MKPQQDPLMNTSAGRLVFGWAVGIVAIGVVIALIDQAQYVDFLEIGLGPTKEQLQKVFVLKSTIARNLFVLILLTGNHFGEDNGEYAEDGNGCFLQCKLNNKPAVKLSRTAPASPPLDSSTA